MLGYSTECADPGDIILAPMYGPLFQGYWMDPVRTVVGASRPDAATRDLIETCADMTAKVMERIKAGAGVRQLAAYADELLTRSPMLYR